MREYDSEPIPGLPEALPEGEKILWQGRPTPVGLARRTFHTGKVTAYLGVLLAWRIGADLAAGQPLAAAAATALPLLGVAAAGVLLLSLLGWIYARTTIYTITDRRIVMRFGIWLPMAFNLPFRAIGAAGLKVFGDGSGDIPLALVGKDHIAYFHLWPHARPWRFTRTEPMLRSIPDAARVGDLLARAMRAAVPGSTMEAPAASASAGGLLHPAGPAAA